jgi:hypothetical protein
MKQSGRLVDLSSEEAEDQVRSIGLVNLFCERGKE